MDQGLPSPSFEPDCASQDADLLRDDIHARKEPGANLAVVRLNEPVDIPPAEVLLDPPRGFSPVQDLFGAEVRLLGRGPEDQGGDFSHMREGAATIDFYTSRPPCPELDFVNHERFVLWSSVPCSAPPCSGQETSQGAAIHLDSWGDLGGPMLAWVGGKEQIIGVAKG